MQRAGDRTSIVVGALLAVSLLAACSGAAATPSTAAATPASSTSPSVPAAPGSADGSAAAAAAMTPTVLPTSSPTETPTSAPTPQDGAPATPGDLSRRQVGAQPPCTGDSPPTAVCMTYYFAWSRPAGRVDGYYFITFSISAVPPDWQPTCPTGDGQTTRLPASATTFQVAETNSGDPLRGFWICAYNDAGVSPLAGF